ncbi:MAG: Jag N-terminal domain-containing protein [Candidatus Hydrogenedentes bacterium]|nr:Jag N-terminal domain-containing protein [Candidatus Hydrogenedentota bacterium]
MRAVEASAATREEAIQNALNELGVEMYEVDKIEVLDEGSRGFLGFGARPVRVKVLVEHLPDEPRRKSARPEPARETREQRPPREERPPRGPRPQEGRGGRPERGERGGRPDRPRQERGPRPDRPQEARPERGPRPERQDRPGRRERPEGRDRQEREARPDRPERQDRPEPPERRERPPRPERPAAAAERGPDRGRGERDRERGRDRERPRGPRPEREQPPAPQAEQAVADAEAWREVDTEMEEQGAEAVAVEAGAKARETSHAEEESFTAITDDQGHQAAGVLQEIITRMGIQSAVDFTRAEDGSARLNVATEDGAILIGRKGRTLGSLQYLMNRMVAGGDAAENTERLVVDVEGYVDRRRSSLEDMARNLARKAKDTQRNMRLKPMSPQERRIIHLTLQDDPDVRTFSIGESLYRSVIISPKNLRQDRERPFRGRGRGGRGRGRGDHAGRRGPGGNGHELDAGQFGD